MARAPAAAIVVAALVIVGAALWAASPGDSGGSPLGPPAGLAAAVRAVGTAEERPAHRRWLARARPLGAPAPRWARLMHRRSLLVLRAMTNRRSGAVVAGRREGWEFVWPRDAGAVAIAFASAGYRTEARRIVRFLLSLDLPASARFQVDGTPVEGRDAQGDAAGWIVAAARAAGLPPPRIRYAWRGRADYQEKDPDDYLANALGASAASADGPPTTADGPPTTANGPAATVDGPEIPLYGGKSTRQRRIEARFRHGGVLVRAAGAPASGVDSAVAWAVRPFPHPALFPAARRSLRRLVAERGGRFGIVPSEDWDGGEDPWTAATAWTAWAFAAVGDRRNASRLLAALRRAATPDGLLPERIDAQTGAPTSTTPLAWSHAFAILALRELWP